MSALSRSPRAADAGSGVLPRPLGSLTLRGRVLLCVGGGIMAGAFLIGERDLVRAGILVALLPLLAAGGVARWPRHLTHARELRPRRVVAGGEARVWLRLTNTSRTVPVSGLLIADTLPHRLGAHPRFTLSRLSPGESRLLSYRLRTHVRGRFPIGPLTVRFRDPLGCVEPVSERGEHESLLVTPPLLPLTGVPEPRSPAHSGESHATMTTTRGEDDIVPREYRYGDDPRRVHWRSTARQGKLMVRGEEQQWHNRSTLLIDLRESAHAGTGRDSSLELAITLAGSIAAHLMRTGHSPRLLTDDAELDVGGREDVLLDTLAVTTSSSADTLRRGSDLLERTAGAGHGLVVAVLGALGDADIDGLARAARGHRCLAVLPHTAAWRSPEERQAARRRFSRHGWSVLAPKSAEEFPRLWHELLAAPPRP